MKNVRKAWYHFSLMPKKTTFGIKNNLQSLIKQVIHENDTIISRSLLSDIKYK